LTGTITYTKKQPKNVSKLMATFYVHVYVIVYVYIHQVRVKTTSSDVAADHVLEGHTDVMETMTVVILVMNNRVVC